MRIRVLVYFAFVGIAFMFIEIAWIERLQRFLGHPVYATTAVLVAFLVFAGLGSLWSQGRVGRERGLLVGAVTAIVILSLAYALFLPGWLNELAALPLIGRLGIVVLLLLSTVRNDLLDDWQRSLPDNAPNHFLINIQTGQVDGINAFFEGQGLETRIYPMVRARLTKINGSAISTDDYESERAKHLLTREFNLSWSDAVPAASRVIEGSWWSSQQHGQPLLSLEEGIGESLRIGMNDMVTFDINGTEVPLRVMNLRKVDWDSFNVNFFTVLPPGLLDQYPASWVTSIYLDQQQKGQLGELVKAYPNVTIIDVGALMTRVRTIMDRVSLAVEFIFLFTLMAGVAVLLAAIQSTQDERRYESAILRTLGAQRGTLMRGLVAEFVTLGALAGLLAGIAATSLAWLFAEQVFKFDYSFNLWIPLAGILAGILIVGVSGVLGTRKVLQQPPLMTLRRA